MEAPVERFYYQRHIYKELFRYLFHTQKAITNNMQINKTTNKSCSWNSEKCKHTCRASYGSKAPENIQTQQCSEAALLLFLAPGLYCEMMFLGFFVVHLLCVRWHSFIHSNTLLMARKPFRRSWTVIEVEGARYTGLQLGIIRSSVPAWFLYCLDS